MERSVFFIFVNIVYTYKQTYVCVIIWCYYFILFYFIHIISLFY